MGGPPGGHTTSHQNFDPRLAMKLSNHSVYCIVAATLQLRATRRQAPITYKCLAEKINLDTSGHFSLWLSPLTRALTKLDAEDRQRNGPRRSSLVVCRKNGRPGEGYWKEKKTGPTTKPGKWQIVAHQKEVNKVFNYYAKDSSHLSTVIVRRLASVAAQ